MKKYDFVIIGSGSGGLSSAYTALGFGKSVALIDKNLPGGECTWSGCIPSKTLIKLAKDMHTIKSYDRDFKIDTSHVMNKVREVMSDVYEGESIDKLRSDGIDFISGEASIVERGKVRVAGRIIECKNVIIATGSSPLIAPIENLENVDYLTNESIFKLSNLPKSIIILGSGAIGVELAQALNRLGVRVELVFRGDRILKKEDEDMAIEIQKLLREEGVNLHPNTKAYRLEKEENHIVLYSEGKEAKAMDKRVCAETILVATGRRPNLEGLGLDRAKIDYDHRGIEVNKYMETSLKGVYAVGDVIGSYQFSHMANFEAICAVQNALIPIKKKMTYKHVVWCTFTDPEFARAGMGEEEIRRIYGDKYRLYKYYYRDIDRAKTSFEDRGLVKIMCDKKGKILGASIIGSRAGELISEIQVIKSLGIKMSKVSGVIHPYPTYSEVINKIGKKVRVDNLLNNPIVKLFKGR